MSDHEETGSAELDHTDELESRHEKYDDGWRHAESEDDERGLPEDLFKWFDRLGDASGSTHSVGETDIKRPSDAIQHVDEAAAARNFVNSEGKGLRRTAFDGVTDDGLVWIAVGHREVNPQTRTLARAELARRNADSMRQSLSASYTLTWAVFGLVALNLLFIVWHVTS
jgi:hypothetical protein